MLGLLNKFKTPGRCGFPLANPHSAEILHFGPPYIVPEGARIIANLNNQSTIFVLNKIDQDQPKNPAKLMLFSMFLIDISGGNYWRAMQIGWRNMEFFNAFLLQLCAEICRF